MPPCFLLWIRGGGGLGELPPIAHTSEIIKFMVKTQNLKTVVMTEVCAFLTKEYILVVGRELWIEPETIEPFTV